MSAFSTRARPSVDEQSDDDGAPARPMPLRSTRSRSGTAALLDYSVFIDAHLLRPASRVHVLPEDVRLTPEPIPTPAFLGDSARTKSRPLGTSTSSASASSSQPSTPQKQQPPNQQEEALSQSSSSTSSDYDDEEDSLGDLEQFGMGDDDDEDEEEYDDEENGDVELTSLTEDLVWSRRSVGGSVAARRAAGRALARWREARKGAEQHALVLFDFVPRNAHELPLRTGELITVTERADFDWWRGRNSTGREGVFPSNFCQVITSRRELRRLRLQQHVLLAHSPSSRTPSVALDVSDDRDDDYGDGNGDSSRSPLTALATPGDMAQVPHTVGTAGQHVARASSSHSNSSHDNDRREEGCRCAGHRLLRWDRSEVISHKVLLFLAILGTLTSATSWLMDLAIDALIGLHRAPLARMAWPLQLLYWLAFSVVLVRLTHFMVQHLSLHCAGSGIPEVKVVLSGIAMPQYISKTVLFGKVVGLVLVVGAGIFAGKQGPMVHIGVMLATALMDVPGFRFVRDTPELRLLALTTGGACGLASHFGTPVTGILFSLELFPSFMPIKTFWFSCVSATIASMLRRATYNLTNSHTRLSITAPILSDISLHAGTWQTQIWTFALTIAVGVACAFFAVVFMQCARTFASIRKYIQRFPISRGQTLYLFVDGSFLLHVSHLSCHCCLFPFQCCCLHPDRNLHVPTLDGRPSIPCPFRHDAQHAQSRPRR